MPRLTALFLLGVIVGLCGATPHVASTEADGEGRRRLSDDEIREKINAFAEDIIDCTRIPALSLAVVRGGEVFLTGGYGLKDEMTQEPMTDTTMVIVASLTKAFVATTVAKALEATEGQYTWASKVKDILGDDFALSDPLRTELTTIRDLLSHRTGLPRNDIMRLKAYSEQEMTRRLRYLDFVMSFRDITNYNNLMYGVASRLVESLTGEHWEELAAQSLFAPLGMDDSTFIHRAMDRWGEFATPYRNSGGTNRPVSLEVAKAFYETFSAPGAISSNAVDMAKWMLFQLNEGKAQDGTVLLDPELLKDTHSPAGVVGGSSNIERPSFPVTKSLDVWALGWQEGHYRGFPISSHTGSQSGFLSMLTLLEAADIGVYVTQTGPGSINRDYLTMYIFDLLLGEEPWLDRSDICGALTTEDMESKCGDPGRDITSYNDILDCLPPNMRQKTPHALVHSHYKADNSTKEKHMTKSGLKLPLQIYEGEYGNYAYGDISIYMNDTAGALQMAYGPTGHWQLTEVSDTVFRASGLGIHWSLTHTLVFDVEDDIAVRFQANFDVEIGPVFVRDLDVDNPPEAPELCPS